MDFEFTTEQGCRIRLVPSMDDTASLVLSMDAEFSPDSGNVPVRMVYTNLAPEERVKLREILENFDSRKD